MNEKKIYFAPVFCSPNFNKRPRIILKEEKLISGLAGVYIKNLH